VSEIVELFVPWLVSICLLFALLEWDESRLTPEQLEHAWPPASLRIAVVYFSVLALPVHFGRTRRTALGVVQGVLWGALILGVDELVGMGVEEFVSHFVAS
jgi:hypothetical protein